MIFYIFAILFALTSATTIQDRLAIIPATELAVYHKVGQAGYLETAITLCDTQMVQLILQSNSSGEYGTIQWKNIVCALMKGSQEILGLVLRDRKTMETVDMAASSNMILKGAAKKGYTEVVDLVFAHSTYDDQIHGQDPHITQFFSLLDLSDEGLEPFKTSKPIEWLLLLTKNNDTVGLKHLLEDGRWDPSSHAGHYDELVSVLKMNQNVDILELLYLYKQKRAIYLGNID